jgi:hypothetical protein
MEDVVAGVQQHWSGVPFALACGVPNYQAENRQCQIEEAGTNAEESRCSYSKETRSERQRTP